MAAETHVGYTSLRFDQGQFTTRGMEEMLYKKWSKGEKGVLAQRE